MDILFHSFLKESKRKIDDTGCQQTNEAKKGFKRKSKMSTLTSSHRKTFTFSQSVIKSYRISFQYTYIMYVVNKPVW